MDPSLVSGHDEEVQAHISFRDPIWLRSFPLNRATVLDYMSNSV
jgi:hypothetical protein